MYIYNKSSHSRQIGEKSFLLFSPPREINLTISIYVIFRTRCEFYKITLKCTLLYILVSLSQN